MRRVGRKFRRSRLLSSGRVRHLVGDERQRLEREHGPLSERLWQLVGPVLERANRPLCPQHAFSLAVIAWNLPFFEHSVREQVAYETPFEYFDVFMELYLARLSTFHADPRLIVQHELVETATGEFMPVLIWVVGDLSMFNR